MNTVHYDAAIRLYKSINQDVLAFGYEAIQAVDNEGATFRQMSIDICGNEKLEDRLSRWAMAARWKQRIMKRSNPKLYNTVLEWLSPSHFTVLWQINQIEGFASAQDAMEQCLIRNLRKEVTQVQPVEWLRGKLSKDTERSTAEIYHKLWRWVGKALPEAYSELERKGLLATRKDRRRVRLLKVMLSEFAAEPEAHLEPER